ncbi:guanylate-binding protein 1-like [Apteryx rowi]|uniref:guanylate-binding protein 1-like n=1 Tax=Apteryx rowi TaxID=308060 RepID=UPI000E1CC767|nr:guanylate-binding protein 1-like [Apteryx rowi]
MMWRRASWSERAGWFVSRMSRFAGLLQGCAQPGHVGPGAAPGAGDVLHHWGISELPGRPNKDARGRLQDTRERDKVFQEEEVLCEYLQSKEAVQKNILHMDKSLSTQQQQLAENQMKCEPAEQEAAVQTEMQQVMEEILRSQQWRQDELLDHLQKKLESQ